MIAHYLTIAFRNLRKYRTQSIISIVGLTVGFVCFALATLWIHYEMTYDAAREGADRTYLLYHRPNNGLDFRTKAVYKMASVLRSEYPEVEAACAAIVNKVTLTTDEGATFETNSIDTDSTFIDMFGSVRLLAGNLDFLSLTDHMALTEEAALALFGTTDVVGKTVKSGAREYTVCAVLSNQPRHSNLYFGCWMPPATYVRESWSALAYTIYVRLHRDADLAAFTAKMHDYMPPEEARFNRKVLENYQLMPLTAYHYSEYNTGVVIDIRYLKLFSAVSALIILCALLNYLSLFVVRMRSRMREGELRRVCGSSRGDLFVLFVTEYLWVLLIAGLLGMAVIEWTLPEFRRLSGVSGGIYGESLLYFAGLLLLSVLFLLPFAWRTRRPTIGRHKHLLSKVSIWLQLVVSVLFIFCVGVLMKQIHYVKTTDIGWERRNTAVIWGLRLNDDTAEALNAYVAATPYIREYMTDSNPLFPLYGGIIMTINNWEGKSESDDASPVATVMHGGPDMPRFYGLKLTEGEWIDNNDPTQVVVNQTMVEAMNMAHPVGKKISLHGNDQRHTIVGVVKDFHTEHPTAPVNPMVILHPKGMNLDIPDYGVSSVLKGLYIIKYEPGTWHILRAEVDSILSRDVEYSPRMLVNVEEAYNESLRSEELLLKFLSLAALTCILTAAFGIFSLVSLSCQQRCKEIAIRKVNGARIASILALFAREYLLMLVLATVVTFPVGYVLMKRWLQSYVEQTPISWWLYAVIFTGTAAVVALCIGWRVWQAARSNPAETIKTE
ncbi:MAG: ABC transporter permease [Prevotellaceae bacterium]|jgi:ABC-type lipoprotein release transport system permease subunit|nr:ABC transporter permease [Prevotellaceae bacterium]